MHGTGCSAPNTPPTSRFILILPLLGSRGKTSVYGLFVDLLNDTRSIRGIIKCMWRKVTKTEWLRNGKSMQLFCHFCKKTTNFVEYRTTQSSSTYFIPTGHQERYYMACGDCGNPHGRQEIDTLADKVAQTVYKHAKDTWNKIKTAATSDAPSTATPKPSQPTKSLKDSVSEAKERIEARLAALKRNLKRTP